MEIKQLVLRDLSTDLDQLADLASIDPQLVLVFGYTEHFAAPELHTALASYFPNAQRKPPSSRQYDLLQPSSKSPLLKSRRWNIHSTLAKH